MRLLLLVPFAFGLNAFAQKLADQQFPHLIIPVDKRAPDKALGTQKRGYVEHAIHTEVSFDVPDIGDAVYCRLIFSINNDPFKNAPRTLWGVPPFRFNISSIEHKMNEWTDTWNNRPKTTDYVGQVELDHKGNVQHSEMGVPCWKGQVAQYVLYPDNPDRDFGFSWYQLAYDPPHGIVYQTFVAA